MIKKVSFTIELKPVTKKNHSMVTTRGGRPMVLPSKPYREYEKAAGKYLKPIGIDYPVNVKATYYMPTRRKVDLINLHAALHDVLVKYGVLVDDNCSIIVSTDGSRVLYDKTRPRTEVIISKEEP